MTQFFKWFLENKEWLLSGLAVSVPIAIIGLLLNRSSSIKRSRSKGSRDINFGKSGSNSNNILMSGDLTVIKNIDDSEITRNQRLSELARFRGKIYELAFDWEHLMDEANSLVKTDPQLAQEKMFQSASAVNRIISLYRNQKHLFDDKCILEIDNLLGKVELNAENSDIDDGLGLLFKAVQLINQCSEEMLNRLQTKRN